MPNTFSPRALMDVQEAHAKELRVEYDGDKVDVLDWHALADMLKPEYRTEFFERYAKVDDLPEVIDGVEEFRSTDGGDDE